MYVCSRFFIAYELACAKFNIYTDFGLFIPGRVSLRADPKRFSQNNKSESEGEKGERGTLTLKLRLLRPQTTALSHVTFRIKERPKPKLFGKFTGSDDNLFITDFYQNAICTRFTRHSRIDKHRWSTLKQYNQYRQSKTVKIYFDEFYECFTHKILYTYTIHIMCNNYLLLCKDLRRRL